MVQLKKSNDIYFSLFEPNQSVFDSDGDDYSHLTLVTDILSTVISVN